MYFVGLGAWHILYDYLLILLSLSHCRISPHLVDSILSFDESPVEDKKEHVQSLIDFDFDPAAPDTAAALAAETKQITPVNTGANLSPHEPLAQDKAPLASNPNTLEFLLFDLASPSFGYNSGSPSTFPENNMAAGGVSSAAPSMHISQ